MNQRLWELCSCKCPPENPCIDWQCERYRKLFEAQLQGKTLPSYPRRIRNFGKAIVHHVKDRMRRVSKVAYKRRMATCKKCPLYHQGQCKHKSCGCVLATKAWWRSETCPLGKWPGSSVDPSVVKPGTLSVAVTTCERCPGTVSDSVRSIIAAGFPGPVVFSEPKGFIPPSVRGFMHDEKRGSFGNFCTALQWQIENDPTAEFYLVFQDDIELTPGLWPWLRDHLPPINEPDFGVASLYTAGPRTSEVTGWAAITTGQAAKRGFGALAYLFTHRSARAFLKDDPRLRRKYMTDMMVGQWCDRNDLKYWNHSPSFVKHTGVRSAIGGDSGLNVSRQCSRFVVSVEPWEVVDVHHRDPVGADG